MALTLTDRTLQVLNRVNIQPLYVLEIDGVETLYTATLIESVIRIGDPGLEIGEEWTIGSFAAVPNQSDTVSLSVGTTEISQQLNPDRGAISSIASMKMSLVDFNDEATALITPGEVVTDLLARRAKVYMGFQGTSYPEDYAVIFRGIIDDIESEQGLISLNIAHPDQKKRNTVFDKAEDALNGSINDTDVTLVLNSAAKFLAPVNGPDGMNDTSLLFYVRIEDEVIQYTGKTATDLTGCTRGALGTVAAAHDDDAEVVSFYRLTGNGVHLALKLMLSGWNGPFQEDVTVNAFNQVSSTLNVPNSMFFYGINLTDKYGVVEGDYVTSTLSAEGANNVSLKQILTIEVTDNGTYIVIDDVTFVDEPTTDGVVAFRSQYDTLGEGLKMHGDEVDIFGHLLWYQRYLSSFSMDFYLKDTIEGKEFIEKKIFLPMGGYSLPRKARSSMGYHSGPIPTEKIAILDNTNITNPKELKLRRSMGKNFYNTIVHQFEEDVLEDKFLFGWVETDATSKARIAVGNRTLTIEANGMRRVLQGASLANQVATRMLDRYKFAAEFIENVSVLFSVGYGIEVGDIVLFDGTNLNISDTVNAVRGAPARFYEVINKRMNIRTGKTSLSLVSTNFSTTSRYGLISPASIVASGASQTTFTIQSSYASVYGSNEYRKWDRYIGCSVRVRNSDFSIVGDAILQSVVGNTITVATALGFTPASGQVMEFSHYDSQPDIVKFIYTFMSDVTFSDGLEQYLMI